MNGNAQQHHTDRAERRLSGGELSALSFPVVHADNPPFNYRESAIQWARENNIIGELPASETNGKGNILISVGSLREMLNPVQIGKSSSLQAHFAAVAVLRKLIRASSIVESYFDRKKGHDGIRHVDNGINTEVLIEVGYAAMEFSGKLHRVKLTLKRFGDSNIATKAYAYHVTQIEVLAGTIGNDLATTAPNANTPTTNQDEANHALTADSLLKGVCDVNGVPFLNNDCSPNP